MKTIIYFVRHAQPDISVKQDDIRPLSSKGIEDSKLVTRCLIDKGINIICSSPYKRSVDTVKHFAKTINLPIVIIDDFRERSVGIWVDDFKAYSNKQWNDFSFKLEGGESLGEAQTRNIDALKKVVNDFDGSSIAIGTHGTALSLIINHFNPDFGYNDFWRIIDKMPFVVCLQFDRDKLLSLEEIDLF